MRKAQCAFPSLAVRRGSAALVADLILASGKEAELTSDLSRLSGFFLCLPVLNPLFRAHGIGGHRNCICLMLRFHTFCEVSRVPTERACHVPGIHSVTSHPVSPGSASRHRRLGGWDSRVTQFSTWLFSSCPSLGGGNESKSQLRGVQDDHTQAQVRQVRLFHP